jgi:hypothetical protein
MLVMHLPNQSLLLDLRKKNKPSLCIHTHTIYLSNWLTICRHSYLAMSAFRQTFTYHRSINWFPGHMARGIRQIKERLQRDVDLVVEVRDARISLDTAHAFTEPMRVVTQYGTALYILNRYALHSFFVN